MPIMMRCDFVKLVDTTLRVEKSLNIKRSSSRLSEIEEK